MSNQNLLSNLQSEYMVWTQYSKQESEFFVWDCYMYADIPHQHQFITFILIVPFDYLILRVISTTFRVMLIRSCCCSCGYGSRRWLLLLPIVLGCVDDNDRKWLCGCVFLLCGLCCGVLCMVLYMCIFCQKWVKNWLKIETMCTSVYVEKWKN